MQEAMFYCTEMNMDAAMLVIMQQFKLCKCIALCLNSICGFPAILFI